MRALISKAKFKLGLLGFNFALSNDAKLAHSRQIVAASKISASSAIPASDTTGAGFLGGAFTRPRDVWFRVCLAFAAGAAHFAVAGLFLDAL